MILEYKVDANPIAVSIWMGEQAVDTSSEPMIYQPFNPETPGVGWESADVAEKWALDYIAKIKKAEEEFVKSEAPVPPAEQPAA